MEGNINETKKQRCGLHRRYCYDMPFTWKSILSLIVRQTEAAIIAPALSPATPILVELSPPNKTQRALYDKKKRRPIVLLYTEKCCGGNKSLCHTSLSISILPWTKYVKSNRPFEKISYAHQLSQLSFSFINLVNKLRHITFLSALLLYNYAVT